MREKVLDERLSSIVSLIEKKASVADIGSDHGYIPLYLLQNNLSDKVLVSDINSGPLMSAEKNFERFGLSEKLVTMQCDGISSDVPSKYNTVIIAGMGGLTICDIIERAKIELVNNKNVLILQPMKECDSVRKKLFEIGYYIKCERRVKTSNNKIYTVIKAVCGNEDDTYSDVELLVGRASVCADKDIYSEDLDKIISVKEFILSRGGDAEISFIEKLKKYRTEL